LYNKQWKIRDSIAEMKTGIIRLAVNRQLSKPVAFTVKEIKNFVSPVN